MPQPQHQWVYLIRFVIGRSGDVTCSVRDVSGSEVWTVMEQERAREILEALERTRPATPAPGYPLPAGSAAPTGDGA